MSHQNRYYYIRAVADGEKYRSFGFCNKSDFMEELAKIDFVKNYFGGYLKPVSVYTLEFWRADCRSGNHYLMGIMAVPNDDDNFDRYKSSVLYEFYSSILFTKNEDRSSNGALMRERVLDAVMSIKVFIHSFHSLCVDHTTIRRKGIEMT